MQSRLLLASGVLLACAAACSNGEPTGSGAAGPGGKGGGGGACPMGPQAMVIIQVTTEAGPLPPDTSIAVTWSAGPEPVFLLDDPTTWKTLDDANIFCTIDRHAPPPHDLVELDCYLWTLGPTEVEIHAKGFEAYHETLKPEVSDRCDGPVPTTFPIVLHHPVDAG